MQVYIAEALTVRYPDVAAGIVAACGMADIRVVPIPDTGNIWARDWMPIKVNDHFVKFTMKADTEKYPQLVVLPDMLGYMRNILESAVDVSDVVLDGGNVLRSPNGARVLMTDMVFEDNPGRHRMHARLEDLLNANVNFLPPEPGDDLGHIDGIVAWIDDRTVFLNDYAVMKESRWVDYGKHVNTMLRNMGIEAVPFPYGYNWCPVLSGPAFRKEFPRADTQNEAFGYAVNFGHWGDLVVYPTFNLSIDVETHRTLERAFPACQLVGVDCTHLSMEGGLIHCVTWEC